MTDTKSPFLSKSETIKKINSFQATVDPLQHQQKLQRTHTIRWLKIIFFFVAVLVSVLLILWPEISKLRDHQILSSQDFEDEIRIRNRLGAPRMHSVDEKGRPYFLKAKTAIQKDKQITDLETPDSTMEMTDGSTMKIHANHGFYNDVTKMLDYQDDVNLETSTGYHFKTSRAFVNLQKKVAFGDQKVVGIGPTGKIWSEGFEAHESGVVRFTGKSRLIISKLNLNSMKTKTEKEKP
ncbi:MAG: LPS export ABC transporter periplasmic protein LptC [Janthinobacterium lividum]